MDAPLSSSRESNQRSHSHGNHKNLEHRHGDQKNAIVETIKDDPRDDGIRGKVVKMKGGGRNTESFDPTTTLVRPDMRVIVGPNREVLGQTIKHDDVIIVPEFFCKEDDWSIYYELIKEMREAQAKDEPRSEWVSWHEGAHLVSHNPASSKTYQMIQEKISKYFNISHKSVGTRFNWYRDSSDWKPFHHDSAAFNPQRAKNQNITVGVSFGARRELAFLNAKNGTKIYFPQTNGMLFSFGRDTNILWKHGVNAFSAAEKAAEPRGRVSIILWGLCPHVLEEPGAPPMLTDNTRGFGHDMHAGNRHGPHSGGGPRGHGYGSGPQHGYGHGHGFHGSQGPSRGHQHDDRGDRQPRGDSGSDFCPRGGDRDRDRDSERDRERDRERDKDSRALREITDPMRHQRDAGRAYDRDRDFSDRDRERDRERVRFERPRYDDRERDRDGYRDRRDVDGQRR